MRQKLTQILIVCALVITIGGHWAILQSVAWVGMTISYSQNSTFKAALVKTLDGQHPCKLCKAVQAGKNSENKDGFVKAESKFDFWLVRGTTLLYPPPFISMVPASADSAQLRLESPPTPPPRAA